VPGGADGPDRPVALIVEDDALIALALSMTLRDLGCEPDGPCAVADDAVRRTFERPPDVVLMDVMLARGSNGLSATRQIADRGGPPVVVCSGHVTGAEARRAGAVGFLPKPYTATDLRRALEDALSPLRFDRSARRWSRA
jgi:CheY-like chemotaxis protein